MIMESFLMSQDVEFTLKENGDVEWKFPDSQVGGERSCHCDCILFRNVFLCLIVTLLKFFVREKASPLLSFSGAVNAT